MHAPGESSFLSSFSRWDHRKGEDFGPWVPATSGVRGDAGSTCVGGARGDGPPL